MTHPTAYRSPRILISIVIVLSALLSACSGSVSALDAGVKDAALESRQFEAAAGQELPKSGPLNEKSPADPFLKPASGADPAESPAALQAELAPQIAEAPAAPGLDGLPAAVPEVDLSLPVQPEVGARAPEFTLQTVDGQSLNLAALIGHPVVISYWATWCKPCQQELPVLQGLHQEYAGQGLVVLTVNAIEQDSLDSVQAMLAEKGMTLPVLLDEGGRFADSYRASFFPTTFYIDPAGVIRFIKLGDSTAEDLRTHVESLLRGQL